MRDLQALAALLLRAGLWTGTVLVAAAAALHLLGGSVERWAGVAAATGIGVIVSTPFVTLLALAVKARRSALGAYAGVTLVLALLGVLLAN